MNKAKSILAVGIIALVYVLPALGLFGVNDTDIRSFENREPQAFPRLKRVTTGEIRAYFSSCDAYIRDHVALRQTALDLVSWIYGYMRVVPDSGNVVLGRDNWLFLAKDDEWSIDKLTGKTRMQVKEAAVLAGKFEKMANAAKERGIDFVIFLPPNKSTLYPEYLPLYVRPAPTRYVQPLLDELARRGIPVFDALETLKAHKKDGLLYFRTDTHWNNLGAFRGFEGLLGFLRNRGVAVDATIPGVSFKPGAVYRGDLLNFGSIYGLSVTPGDEYLLEGLPDTMLTLERDGKTSAVPFDTLIHLFPGQYARVVNPGAAGKPDAWVFRDSFSAFLSPLYHATFHSTTHQYYKNGWTDMGALLDSSSVGKPDIVIYEIVERFFDSNR